MKEFICPRCHKKTKEYPAISRRDNKTEICSNCGVIEAIADFHVNAQDSNDQKVSCNDKEI